MPGATIGSYFLYVYTDGSIQTARLGDGAPTSENCISMHILNIYDDTSIDVLRLEQPARTLTPVNTVRSRPAAISAAELPPCSARMCQILSVLIHIRDHHRESDSTEHIIQRAIKYVAQNGERPLPVSTVSDKLCRQTGVNIAFWREKIGVWLNTGDITEIKEHLLKNYSPTRKSEDQKAVETFAQTAHLI